MHLTTMGLDGVVLSWVNDEAELAQWISDVLPVMEQVGLRRPYAPPPTHACRHM
jgi:hypothetical protein